MNKLISIVSLLLLSSCSPAIADFFKANEDLKLETEIHFQNKEKNVR